MWLKSNGQPLDDTELEPIKYIGGDGADGALTVAAGTTNISGFKNYTTITVNNGATLNIQGPTIACATGAVSISGAITSDSNTTGYSCAEQGHIGTAGLGGPGGFSGIHWLRHQYQRVPLGGGSGGDGGIMMSAGEPGSINTGRCGGGGGGGAGCYAGGRGNSGGTANLSGAGGRIGADETTRGIGGNPKFGLCLETRDSITFGATATVTLTGGNGAAASDADSGNGAGAGGSALQCLAIGNLTFTAGAAITVAGGNGTNTTGSASGSGAGGLIGFWYGGTYTSGGTGTVTGGTATGATAGQNGLFFQTQLTSL